MTAVSTIEFSRVLALAERLGIPAAAVMRRAVGAYVASFRPPMENAMNDSKTSNTLQGDLLNGQWSSKPSRRGDGQHIRLKSLGDEQLVAVPGMADFSGGGPAGAYCQDCSHFASEIAVQTGIDAIERTRNGCVLYSRRMGQAGPSPRRDIRLCRSCKYFEEAADASPRCFIVDMAGMSYRLGSMPEDPRGWLREKHNGI